MAPPWRAPRHRPGTGSRSVPSPARAGERAPSAAGSGAGARGPSAARGAHHPGARPAGAAARAARAPPAHRARCARHPGSRPRPARGVRWRQAGRRAATGGRDPRAPAGWRRRGARGRRRRRRVRGAGWRARSGPARRRVASPGPSGTSAWRPRRGRAAARPGRLPPPCRAGRATRRPAGGARPARATDSPPAPRPARASRGPPPTGASRRRSAPSGAPPPGRVRGGSPPRRAPAAPPGLVRIGPQRRLEPLPSAVLVLVLEPGREQLGLGIAGQEVRGAAGFPSRRVLPRVLGELLAEGRREIHAGLALGSAARPGRPARERRHERFHADGARRRTGGERRSGRHGRRSRGDGLADQVGETHRERHLALILRELHEDPVRAPSQRDLHHGLVEPGRVVGGLGEHLRSIHPEAKGATGPDPEPDPLLPGHLGNGERVDHRLPLRPNRRADGEDAAKLQLGRQGAPAHLARLAGESGAEVERALGRELALEASSPLVVEGAGDPPAPEEPEPLPLGLRPLRIAACLLDRGEKPARQRPDLGVRPGIVGDGAVGRRGTREVGERGLELADADERRDGARLGVALAQLGRGGLECGGGGIAARLGGGGRPGGEQRQGEEKGGEQHARSLPPERPANSADRSCHPVLSPGPVTRPGPAPPR